MLRVHNTAGRRLEEFEPREPGRVGMYVCGLTVYNDLHMGHARCYVAFDTIRRWLIHDGYDVTYVQNHTDIDDKIIAAAAEQGIKPHDLAERYIERTTADLRQLNILGPTKSPRATTHIDEMIALVENLVAKGHAYVTEPAPGALAPDVYFHVPSAAEMFGTLKGQSIEEMEAGARVVVDSRKRHPADFALWKGAKPGEPQWESPWGPGRPGWHIECSAMSMRYLGEQFDIHGGGNDLIFPHHESEILQSQCRTGKSPWVRYWLHSGFLTLNREKMSKSLGNFFTLREVLEHHPAMVIRFYLVNAHYRSPIDFSEAQLTEAAAAYDRLAGTLHRYRDAETSAVGSYTSNAPESLTAAITRCRSDFTAAMDDDFNTREALAALFTLAREANRHEPAGLVPETRQAIVELFEELGSSVLGLFQTDETGGLTGDEIAMLLDEREQARATQDWTRADVIRDRLAAEGIEVQDTPEGARWRRKG